MREKLKRVLESIQGINITQEIVVAFLFGGLLMTLINPLIVPPVQDFQKDVGILPTPEPDITIQYNNQTDSQYIRNSTSVDPNESQYRIFHVKIKNPSNKVMTDVNTLALFSGCPVTIGISHTNLDSVLTARQADGVDTRRVLGDCGAEVDIEELPPKKSVMMYVIVNTTEENYQVADYELRDREVVLLGNYEWTYNGRTYYQSVRLRGIVADKLEATDLLN